MKIVALGVTQGHRLRFVAEGDDAKQAIEALGKIICEWAWRKSYQLCHC